MNIPNQVSMQKVKIIFLIILSSTVLIIMFNTIPDLSLGIDWLNTYRPAALAMVQGKSPYNVEIYYAAPWAVIPLIPFALLPEQVGNAGVFLLGLLAFSYTAYKLGATPAVMIIFLLSASVVGCLTWGNIEWMPLLGLVLPAPIGLIFAITKPQVGIGIVIYWFVHILQTRGMHQVIKTFLPVTLVSILSFWIYGFWPLRFQQTLTLSANSYLQYNTSLWPQGFFIGIWLLYKSIQKNQPRMAMAASPFLSPYALQFTWVAVLTGLIHAPLELFIVSIGLWIPVVLRFINS